MCFDTSKAKKTKKLPIDLQVSEVPWRDWYQPGILLVFAHLPSQEFGVSFLEPGNKKAPQRGMLHVRPQAKALIQSVFQSKIL